MIMRLSPFLAMTVNFSARYAAALFCSGLKGVLASVRALAFHDHKRK